MLRQEQKQDPSTAISTWLLVSLICPLQVTPVTLPSSLQMCVNAKGNALEVTAISGSCHSCPSSWVLVSQDKGLYQGHT